MNILSIDRLRIPDIQVIRFARHADERGYFTEHLRGSALRRHEQLAALHDVEFVQCNESFSRPGTIRGLHLQWSPCQGKLVRAVQGRLIDLALDARRGSPTFGKIVAYELGAHAGQAYGEWLWLPPGFAHGICFLEAGLIEYLCTGEYSPGCEASISPLADDIDWSLCDRRLKAQFDQVAAGPALMSDKDRAGLTLAGWATSQGSEHFVYNRAAGDLAPAARVAAQRA